MFILSPSFFDWWFAPWTYATCVVPCMPMPVDRLGQRDAYRLWCEQARISPDLPERFDPGWSAAAEVDERELTAAARLFAGLIAARQNDRKVLDALSAVERKWCANIAATQPLQSCQRTPYALNETAETRGLVELAHRLERGFPGMWPRLRLLLSAELTDKVECLLRTVAGVEDKSSAPDVRAQRCWRLCRNDKLIFPMLAK